MTRTLAVLAAAALLAALPLPGGGQAPERTGYAQWENGPPADPNFFPLAVWLQQPRNARRYQEAGINLYVGLWQGPTDEQLDALRAAGMPVICHQNELGLARRENSTIVAWMHPDEPDNAQPVVDPDTGQRRWGPFIPPERIVADYRRFRTADPTRPVFLNLGKGVADDGWVGRGPGARLEDYETYVQGADIVSFDIYPVASGHGEDQLHLVPKGVERLVRWTEGRKPVWNCIETTRISHPEGKRATPHQVRAQVWMALVHGSTGLIYFVHEFEPRFREAALLEDPDMLAAVTALNREITELAPVLNSPTIPEGTQVTSDSEEAPVAAMAKRHAGATYIFAVGMRSSPARATFTVAGLPGSRSAEVLGERRTLPVRDGRFADDFAPYDARTYRIR